MVCATPHMPFPRRRGAHVGQGATVAGGAKLMPGAYVEPLSSVEPGAGLSTLPPPYSVQRGVGRGGSYVGSWGEPQGHHGLRNPQVAVGQNKYFALVHCALGRR